MPVSDRYHATDVLCCHEERSPAREHGAHGCDGPRALDRLDASSGCSLEISRRVASAVFRVPSCRRSSSAEVEALARVGREPGGLHRLDHGLDVVRNPSLLYLV
jgi:hypothetical protein